MTVITTGSHPKHLWPGINAQFGTTYAEKPMVCDRVFDKQKSNKAWEEYVENTGFGLAPVKPEADAISYDTDQQGYVSRITNVTYALGAMVSQEAIDDNLYEDVAKKKSRMLARSMRQTKETVAANILNRAFDATAVGGDGAPLISDSHPTLGGNASNVIGVAADLSEASLEDLLTKIRRAQDARGLRIQLRAEMLIIPPEMEFEATRILKSTLQSNGESNNINAIREMGMLPQGFVVWDYLTDPDAFFIKTDADVALIRQQRKAVGLAQDNDFDTSNARMKASERYAFGWADWRGLYGSPGA